MSAIYSASGRKGLASMTHTSEGSRMEFVCFWVVVKYLSWMDLAV